MATKEQWENSRRRKELGLAWCSKCKQDKPHHEFMKCPGRRPFGLSSHCLICDSQRKAKQKRNQYWSLDENARKNINRKKHLEKFNLLETDYNDMIETQKGKCAICGNAEFSVHHHSGKIRRLSVDHCHQTGKVRGLLCNLCNKGLGHFKDNVDYLIAAIKYLEKYKDDNGKRI